MKHIFTTLNSFIHKPLLLAFTLLAMSSNAWGLGYAKLQLYSSPTDGGYVYANTSNKNNIGTLTSDDATSGFKGSAQTLYRFAKAKDGYTFKGWATSTNSNSGSTSSSVSVNVGSWGGTHTDTYYAIFAKMTANKSSIAFDETLVGAESDAVTVTVSHAHAGSITAALSGSNSGDFILSKTNIATSTTAGTATFTVKFKPKATGSRSATLTISSNNGLASISIALSGTGMSTVEPEYSCSIANEYHVGDAAINLNSLWTSTSPAAKVYSIKSFTPSGSNNSGATAPAISGTNLSLGQAGTLVLGLTQAATTGYYAGSAEKTIIIKKRNNTLYVNGSASYNPTMTMDGELAIALTATNTDYSGSPISISQTAGSTIAVYNASTKKITSNINLGTATWSISQPENYKYKAASGSFTVNVVAQAETTCTIFTHSANQDLSIGSESTHHEWTAQASKTLSFEASKSMATAIGDLEVYVKKNSSWSKLTSIGVGDLEKNSYKSFSYNLDREVTGVYFKNAGSYTRSVKNISVTRKTWLNPTMTSTSFTTTDEGNPIYRNQEGHQTLTVKWSIANGGDINIVSTNPKFTVSPNKITNTDCANGSNDITVTYASADAGTDNGKIIVYNRVFRKEIDVTGTTSKRTQTIVWNTDLTTIPVGYDLSARTSENQPVTYESSDSDVIEVLPNGTLDVKAAGSATITAHGAANEEYNDVEDAKTFTVTNDLIQYIVWEQNLMNMKLGGANVTLTAYATQEEEGVFPERVITYESGNNSIVKVVGTNTLQIVGVGSTTLTATQAGGSDGAGHEFAPVSTIKKVVVRDPSAACENFVFQQSSEKELFEVSFSDLSQEYSLSGEPEFLSVDLKRKYYKIPVIGTKLSEGDMILEQYVNNEWQTVRTFAKNDIPVSEDGSAYKTFSNIRLNRAATKIRFKTSGRRGYFYVNNCEVSLARYIESSIANHDFGQINVGSQESFGAHISYNNIQDGLTLTTDNDAYVVSPTYIDGSCGDKGSFDITITYHPTVAATPDNATLTISDGHTNCVIALTGSATKMNRTIHWDNLPEYNEVYMYQRITLDAMVTASYDASIQAGEVEYVYSTDSKSFVDGKVRFLSDGDFTITAQAPETNEYNAAPEVTKHFHVLYRNDFTFEGQDAVWSNENNWNTGAEPVPASDVTIDEDVVLQTTATINSLTINEGKTLTIADGGVLNVGNGNSLSQATYGNIIVEAGGQLLLNEGNVEINDFTLYSTYEAGNPKSGQVSGAAKLNKHGHAYFIIDLDPAGNASAGWYDFTVPFPVNALTGITRSADGETWNTIVNERNYAIMDFHEDLRAQGQYAWKKYRGILQPGVAYTMTIDSRINKYRFEMAANGAFNTATTQALQSTNSSEDAGWNGVGNGTMSYITLREAPVVQMYNHAENAYNATSSASQAFAVGAAYFVQRSDALSELTMDAAYNAISILRAPQREQEEYSEPLTLTLSQNGLTRDNLFVTCSESATDTYTRGFDVQKLGKLTAAKVARLWTNTKGKDLCAVYAPYNANEAIIPLQFFAPEQGEYTLSIDRNTEEGIYLTRNGVIIWDMNMSDYNFTLEQGTDNSYALQVIRRTQNVATGAEQLSNDAQRGTDFVEKMIVNGQLFILRDGNLYDAQGKKVTAIQ